MSPDEIETLRPRKIKESHVKLYWFIILLAFVIALIPAKWEYNAEQSKLEAVVEKRGCAWEYCPTVFQEMFDPPYEKYTQAWWTEQFNTNPTIKEL